MNRRELIKLLLAGAAGHVLDVDRLLWVPGAKKIFLPPVVPWIHKPSLSEIMAVEYLRVMPKIKELFERDDIFYQTIKRRE